MYNGTMAIVLIITLFSIYILFIKKDIFKYKLLSAYKRATSVNYFNKNEIIEHNKFSTKLLIFFFILYSTIITIQKILSTKNISHTAILIINIFLLREILRSRNANRWS